MVVLMLFAPLSARTEHEFNHAHKVKKPKVVTAFLTFHNARPRRKTCTGKLQSGRIAAINRNKKHWLMGKRIVPFAYLDKKTGQKVFISLPSREIADVMGPGPRSESRYHIDYYLSGTVPAKYDNFNNTIWYFKVVG